MNYNIFLILPLLLALFQSVGLQAAPDWTAATTTGPRQDFERKFSKSYDVNSNGSVRLDNRYGEINVETWTQNKVQIDVRVKVTASSQDKANQVFDRITIDFTGGGNRATATTSIGNASGGGSFFGRILSGDWGWSESGNDYKIYYSVKMPAATTLETVAKYCDVRLPALSGDNTTTVGYGDLVAGKLTGSNTVEISYGSIRAEELGKMSSLRQRYSEATIRKADRLKYDGRYSELTLNTANVVTLDVGYEEVDIERAQKVTINGNYNDVELGEVDVFEFDGSYTGYSVDKVNTSITGETNYGDVDVDALGNNFTKVYIRTRYADVNLGMPSGRGYDVDINTRYGDIGFRGDGQLNRNSEGTAESLKGKVSGSGQGSVDISTSYGDVSLR